MKKKCTTCNGRKTIPKQDYWSGRICGSIKCWDCNNGIYPIHWMDNY